MDILKKASEWFISVKAPDLKDRVENGIKLIENKEPLESKDKKLFGFILFDYSMHFGPNTFKPCEDVAIEINVLTEMEEYALSWINHSKKNSNENR